MFMTWMFERSFQAIQLPCIQKVHHNIRNALDSHDNVEMHAAILAASRFAARSKTFAVNMCSKISDMIRGYATPLDMKLRLIPIFQVCLTLRFCHRTEDSS